MDESKTAQRLFREGRYRMYKWFQKWMGRGANDETEEVSDPVDVSHIVNLLRAGLGFRLRHVDSGQGVLPCEEGPGCRIVATCTISGLRAVLELPQATCCCRPSDPDVEPNFWSVSSSMESLHEAGCSSLPELNQGLGKVVKEVLRQLHHVMIELNNPLALREVAAKLLTTGSLRSLTPSPGLETMRRASSSPILSNENCAAWINQNQNEQNLQLKREESAVSLQEFPSIPSTEISPIKGSVTKSVPSFRTSSPQSVQSSLERLSIRSNSNIIEKLEHIHKELGQVLTLAKNNSSAGTLVDRTKKVHGVISPASSTPISTPKSSRKQPVSKVPASVSRIQPKRALQTPQALVRDRTMVKPNSTVKKFFSGSKLKSSQSDTQSSASKATPIVAKRRILPQPIGQKLKPDQRKIVNK